MRRMAMLVDEMFTAGNGAECHIKNGCENQSENRHSEHAEEHRYPNGVAHFRSRTGRQHHGNHTHDERERGHQYGAQAQPTCVKMLLSPLVIHTPKRAENMLRGTTRITARGRVRLSYSAASTRNTMRILMGNTTKVALPANSC